MGENSGLERQAIIDDEHLKLLSIFYWVTGAMTAFFAMFALIYIVMGVVLVSAPLSNSRSAPEAMPPAFIGWFMIGIGATVMISVAALGLLKILTGFWIRRRKNRIGCLMVAGLCCAGMPFGTLLGVCTFMVLLRPTVRELFLRPSSKTA